MTDLYPRDLRGYAADRPAWRWPEGKRIAVSVVINWEEGAEHNILHGDDVSENTGCDVGDGRPRERSRDLRTESMYNFGTRVGVWRLLDILDAHNVPATVFACGMAVERYPELAAAMTRRGHELCGHGYRWIDYHDVDEATERAHIARTVSAMTAATGHRPLGWYTGRTSPNTRRLVIEEGGFVYDSDAYDDELPYGENSFGTSHVVVPYAFDTNDMRFATSPGLATGRQFGDELIDSLDELLADPVESPRMMSIGLHLRLAGRPARAHAVRRFLEYATSHPEVWFARRIDIARWWMAHESEHAVSTDHMNQGADR
ncbi:polysaccharide deacetylase family protein [Gordonia sp. SID5947]|uniref:allantoinase PuuE n=1 Tax=Gordonia sp. SID5947 TaxID=2690315 RepID=UPI001371D492|nr:allantoinase PuuE [Gordonia sp. SID5947]MYR07789.1 polysaccharide deacetylase family protein [Gordonia sp. SID5947]